MQSFKRQHREDFFETVIENAYYCFVVVDEEGFITYMNKSYLRFLEVENVVGKHVTEIIENTRMHIVVKTGKEEIADLQYIRGNYMVANRIPVRSADKIVGAVGTVIFRDTKEWMKMNSHIKDLLLEIEHYRSQLQNLHGKTYSLGDIVGSSRQLNELKNKIKKVSPGDVSVLVRGESGTGKELVAHSIHHLSERSRKPFIAVNCAAIPEHLLESELFGYKEGAFTGAKKGGKTGKFQLADGGTLFLDEIGDMPLATQVKILRVLQEGEVDVVGGTAPQPVDVRLIAATNQPLEKLIATQRFREDLFYRINVIQLRIPPLRERMEDIRVLANYILRKVTNRTGKRVVSFDSRVLDRLMQHHWPGNVRELENMIESAVHLTNKEVINVEDLPESLQTDAPAVTEQITLKEKLEQTEKMALRQALEKSGGDKAAAARMLGIGKSSLYDKLKKHQL